MKTLAIMIKTFMRSDCLTKCIQSIESHVKDIPYRIYIADDGNIDSGKSELYDTLEKKGHFILKLPFDIGASAGRNALIPHIQEKYLLRLDDDFLFTTETHIDKMIYILDHVDNIGAISDLERQLTDGKGINAGSIQSSGQGFLRFYVGTLIKEYIDLSQIKYDYINSIRYCKCEFARNFLLIRRSMLEEIKWDEELKIQGEHVDFMMQIKNHPYWQLAFTPDSIHSHAGPPDADLPLNYLNMRNRKNEMWPILFRKWGIFNIASANGSLSKRAKLGFFVYAPLLYMKKILFF
ncbi:MAG TPA: glycosyltransferase [Desulfobacteraceae bacterium]|nr:glycosyltransferase [Desulfobacteraceae bacterium]HPJ67541.1 glycosyltransferase [Desulfobacteraceae bacterium]HPQ28494.1 glycosyltransferase [Desulfobacteraceae bacterium]